MNLLAELLPEGLLQRTDRQASVITAFIAPLNLGGSLLADQRQTPDSEQSLGPDVVLAFWGILGLVLPKCQGTEVTTSAPAPQAFNSTYQTQRHHPHKSPAPT